MKRPQRSDEELLADVQAARRAAHQLHLWWLGQSGFLAQWQGQHLLIDPYLSDSLTRKYAGTDKPHERLTARVIAPERLNFIRAVTSSHNHTDHLDPDTLQPLARVNPDLRLICARANRAEALRRSGLPEARVLDLDPDNAPCSVAVDPFECHAVPAAHEQLERDAAGLYTHVGFVVKAGPFTLFHPGDTVRYDGLVERLRPFAIDVALLPINGRAPARRVAGNLWGREAAALAKDLGAGVVVPCHYDLFAFNTASPDEFTAECQRLDQRFCVLENGGRLSWPETALAAP
ncbi:MAG: MBL fold metallo-hydrolase [Verrucomicrobia bacterium]|nr:MBL fold metallo-hydrolase [Verrucomicrobiota bacterium]